MKYKGIDAFTGLFPFFCVKNLKKGENKMDKNTGCRIAQRITASLCGQAFRDYEVISKLVYSECMAIAEDQENGDWIEMPNGDTYTKSFTVKR